MVVGERPAAPARLETPVEARVLGGFSVQVRGRDISRTDWQRLSAERLFKLLLVTPGHRLSRELAAETLWPGATPEAGRASLRKAILYARRALSASGALTGDAGLIALADGAVDVDLDRLAAAFHLLDESRHPEVDGWPPDRRAALDAALDTVLELGARDLLPDDLYEDWLVGPRERLRGEWLRMAMRAASDARAEGRSEQALSLVDRVLERDPTDEAAHRLAIELYAAEGRHHAARRQFDRCRAVLRETLDIDPAPETVAAFKAAERSAARDVRPARPAGALVARRTELERIEPALDRLAGGAMAVLILRGPAGIGKTRLLQEVGAYGRAAGWRVIGWQAVESMRMESLAPLRIGLAESLTADEVRGWAEPARSGIATLVPALGPPALTFRDRPTLVAALVDVLVRMARGRPLVLAIDDLPWLDDASLELLTALAAGWPACPILVAATYRDDEPVPEAVDRLAGQARRSGSPDIRLGPLARRDIEPLIVGHMGGESVQEDLCRSVFDLSGGNPLFCLEAMRAGQDRGVVRLADGRWTIATGQGLVEVPESARLIAARRCAALPSPARELLDVAAELGPMITFEVLKAAVPLLSGELIGALDDALRSGLLVERHGGYAFAHPLYRLAVRTAAGPARRAGVHLAIARALAGEAAATSDPAALRAAARRSQDPGLTAAHATEAAALGVRDAVPLAIAFGLAAGARHAALHDREAAIALYERALDLWRLLPHDSSAAWGVAGDLVSVGELWALAGDMPAATASFREATAAARDPEELASSYYAFADAVPYRQGDFDRARAVLEEGLARLPSGAAPQRAWLQAAVGWNLVRMQRITEALPLIEAAVRVLDGSPNRRAALRALDMLGVTLHYAGRSDEGREHVERALALAVECGDSTWEAVTNLHLGALLARRGAPGPARPFHERALELARLTGDRYVEAIAVWGVAEAADALGDYPAAIEARRQEIRLLDAIGGNAHNAAMSHAHLSHLARLMGDGETAEREAGEARRLARASDEPGYPARIEQAIAIERWSDLET